MKRINPETVWKPVGFVHATANGTILITSGQTGRGLDGKIVSDSFAGQARQALQNLKNIVTSQGKSLDDVMKVTVFIKDVRYAAEYHEIAAQFFSADKKPASSLIGVTGLWDERQLIEIEAMVDLT